MMNTALLGVEATAGFSASALAVVQEAGLGFATIPAGWREIGAEDMEDNPVRMVIVDSFQLADTVLTNQQMAALMKKLGDKTTVAIAKLPNYQAVVVARGTRATVHSLSSADLEGAVKEVVTASHILVAGGFAILDLSSVMKSIRVVTLEHHLLDDFNGDNQPALVSGDEASAIAAVLGVELPLDEQWEAAAGDLRGPAYLDVINLRKVAHFSEKGSKHATEAVKSRAPNQYGLYEMLGNVWEWMANLYNPADAANRSLRGGSWGDYPKDVRAAFRSGSVPIFWGDDGGVRLSRPLS